MRYNSEFRIKNRTELRCFNTIYLDDNLEREYKIMNTYEDCRAIYQDWMNYRVIVFDHVPGRTYRFTYDLITNANADPSNLQSGDVATTVLKTFDTRSEIVGTQLNRKITNPQVWLLDGNNQYQKYGGDWALYEGYVGETGNVDIEIVVRSAAKPAKPSQPRYFHLIHFGGADEGMKMTISDQVELKPIFLPHPAEGDTVEFAQIAAHEIHQIDVVNGIKQMFNLYFYTDSDAKIIYAEPRDTFYRTDTVVDWSDRIDYGRPVTCEELGGELSQLFTLRYQPGDGTVARWDESNKQVMGRWSAPVLNRFAKEGEKVYYNPVFTATLNRTDVYPNAPSASVMQVGDRDRKGLATDTENLNFPPKIVRYTGTRELPATEWWGWPNYDHTFPEAAFHNDSADGFTFCFEDRDSHQGLHARYDRTLALYNGGKRIMAYLYLTPEEVESFIKPNALGRDFRALFKLRIGGESVLCRLEELSDYNPAGRKSTKCVFITTS